MSTRSWDPAWEAVFRSQAWGKYPPEHVIRWAARHFYQAPDRNAIRILDLGSGPGACSWYLCREGFQVDAIDGSPTAIAQLQARLAAENLAAHAQVGDFVQLPFADHSFDGVVDNAALYCNPFATMRQVVTEVHRVLKPGGSFSSANFTDRSWGYGLGRCVEPGGYTDITEGPLAGKGFSKFLGRAEVDALYEAFAETHIETVSWTLDNRTRAIELWVVTCRKAP